MDFASGYVLRAAGAGQAPGAGDRAPWQIEQHYLTDLRTIRRDALDDGVLSFA